MIVPTATRQWWESVVNGTAGNLTTDAHLAAVCIDHNAVLYTADNDFARFTALRRRNPFQ